MQLSKTLRTTVANVWRYVCTAEAALLRPKALMDEYLCKESENRKQGRYIGWLNFTLITHLWAASVLLASPVDSYFSKIFAFAAPYIPPDWINVNIDIRTYAAVMVLFVFNVLSFSISYSIVIICGLARNAPLERHKLLFKTIFVVSSSALWFQTIINLLLWVVSDMQNVAYNRLYMWPPAYVAVLIGNVLIPLSINFYLFPNLLCSSLRIPAAASSLLSVWLFSFFYVPFISILRLGNRLASALKIPAWMSLAVCLYVLSLGLWAVYDIFEPDSEPLWMILGFVPVVVGLYLMVFAPMLMACSSVLYYCFGWFTYRSLQLFSIWRWWSYLKKAVCEARQRSFIDAVFPSQDAAEQLEISNARVRRSLYFFGRANVVPLIGTSVYSGAYLLYRLMGY